jgi:casein kinase 1
MRKPDADVQQHVGQQCRSHLAEAQKKLAQTQRKLADAQLTGLLKGLAQIHINTDNIGRPVLGDRKNVQGGGGNGGDLLLKQPGPADVVVISDDERSPGGHGPVDRYDKAARLIKLTRAAGQAADNRILARLTDDFVKVLRNSNSRTLTREGFAFLDALHKQLADPSVFIVPLRSSKTRSSRSQRDQESAAAEEAPRERRSRLNGLCSALEKARDNKTVAGLVAEFGALIDKTAGRKLTKDGMMFLEIVADRLLVVRV